MIDEVMTWLLTPCAPQARKLGYLYESIAMRERVRRCQSGWQSHLQHAQNFIQSCINKQPKGGVALIFGSGLSLDLPIDDLAQHFDEVWLVDMVHLRSAKSAWKKYKNIHFYEHDVTQSLEKIAEGKLSRELPTAWLNDNNIKFVVSANILCQLPLQPLAWLGKHFPALTEDDLHDWSISLIQAHLTYLNAFQQNGATVCLISDLEWRYEENNQIKEVIDAWRGLDQPMPQEKWEWRIAPRGELRGNRVQTNWVGGWCWSSHPT